MISRPAVSAGSIPAGWILKPLKHNLRRLSDKGNGAGKVMALENIEGWTGKELETGSTFDGDGVKFQPDDLLFGKLRPYLAKVFLAREPGDAVGDLWALRPEPACDPKFMFYVLVNQMFIDVVNGSTNGAKMPRAEWSYVGAIGVPTPPHGDQMAIARFLDRETDRIDGLIEKKTRFIALLKEKRAAVITHAVTKGIDPDAPMKDSGADWLGRVPTHWEVTPMKYVVSFIGGATPSKLNDEFWSGIIPWVSPKDMKQAEIADSIDHVSEAAVAQTALRVVEPNAVLIVVRGMILAHTFPVAINLAPVTINQDMKAIRCGSRLLPEFLHSIISGLQAGFVGLADTAGHGTRKIETHSLGRCHLPLPSLDEQKVILASIKAETARIDGLITLTERSIDLLREKRAALITAAVTGKIDVKAAA